MKQIIKGREKYARAIMWGFGWISVAALMLQVGLNVERWEFILLMIGLLLFGISSLYVTCIDIDRAIEAQKKADTSS